MNILFIFKHQTKHNYHHLPIFLFIIIFLSPLYSSLVEAQRINSDWDSNPFYTAGVVLVTFAVLSFLVYLLIYLFYKRFVQRWATRSHDHRVHAGLDPSILRTFPVFVYSTMTGFKPNSGPGLSPGLSLSECAICLGMFERDETLRLLPKCGHVFHVDCVDPWLAGHTTCPLCRANLVSEPGELTRVESDCVAELGCEEGEVNEVQNDAVEVRREIKGVQSGNFWRWNSTGHVVRFEGMEEDQEKSTAVRKDIVRRELNRSKSCIIITLELG